MRYEKIKEHYENCLKKHGPTHKGVDWPNKGDMEKRFHVMAGLFEGKEKTGEKIKVLDLGCGFGLFLEYLRETGKINEIDYTGIDISGLMIAEAKKLHPGAKFLAQDILKEPLVDESFDYAVMNGVLTEKRELSQEEMCGFAKDIIKAVFKAVKGGIAFNAMNHHVDWQRDDLFHWPFDEAAAFFKKECSRHYMFRSDYGLYEFTAYLFKEPRV